MNASDRRVPKWLLAGVAVACLGAAAITLLWWLGQENDWRTGLDWVLAQVRAMGPAAFFTMMALLPGAGVPVTFFNLTAGSVFVPVLGLPLVLLLVVVSLGVNLIITYAVGRWLLRPWVGRAASWLGFKVPVIARADEAMAIVLLRLIPGPPFMAQNYLMGMAGFSFGTYLAVSWPMAVFDGIIYIVFGSALMAGSGRLVVLAISLAIALILVGRWIKRFIQKRNISGSWERLGKEPRAEGDGERTGA